MRIASHVFLLIFLPLTLTAYYAFFRQPRTKLYFLLFASYAFYALVDWRFLPLLFLLSFLTFWLARRGWIWVGVVLNLASLAFFKFGFFPLDAVHSLAEKLGARPPGAFLEIALPLGISFFVFKHIGYLLDVGWKKFPASADFLSFAVFSAYFPQISAGPVSGYRETADQFDRLPSRPDADHVHAGLLYITIGLAKKTLLADALGAFLASTGASGDGALGLIPAWYMVAVYAMQMYFDFSGYTDMALGMSMLFGVVLPPNFNNPYLARDPADFWGRWHMSLSNWFRSYVFSPVSRLLRRKWSDDTSDWTRYLATFLTMTLVGLWHGAGFNYILWGAYFGFLLILHAWWKKSGRTLPEAVARVLFLTSLMFGWAIFMSPDFSHLQSLILQMIGAGGLGARDAILQLASSMTTPVLLVAILLAASGFSEAAAVWNVARTQKKWYAILWGVLAGLSLLFLSARIQFLYAQF